MNNQTKQINYSWIASYDNEDCQGRIRFELPTKAADEARAIIDSGKVYGTDLEDGSKNLPPSEYELFFKGKADNE